MLARRRSVKIGRSEAMTWVPLGTTRICPGSFELNDEACAIPAQIHPYTEVEDLLVYDQRVGGALLHDHVTARSSSSSRTASSSPSAPEVCRAGSRAH